MKRYNPKKNRNRQMRLALLKILGILCLVVFNLALVYWISTVLNTDFYPFYLALEVLAILFSFSIFAGDRTSDYKIVWILLLTISPVIGIVLFFLWGHRGKYDTSLKNIRELPKTKSDIDRNEQNLRFVQKEFSRWANPVRFLTSFGYSIYRNTKLKYYDSGEEAWQSIIEQMEHAQRFIFMEFFVVSDGELLGRIINTLYDRVSYGVEVKVILDDFGSLKHLNQETIDDMIEHGIEVKRFHPLLKQISRFYINYRDHRKIVCIDGNFAMTGGINCADEYANIISLHGYWKDNAITMEGQAAWSYTKSFMHSWQRLDGKMHEEVDYYRPESSFKIDNVCVPFFDGPYLRPLTPAEDLYASLISSAQNSIIISSPYLCLDEMLLRNICIASDSGVQVYLYLPGQSDHILTDYAGKSYFDSLLKHGVHIYLYEKGILHQKCVVVDGEAAVVGTVNTDYRSFQLHYECGLLFFGDHAVDEVIMDFDLIRNDCKEITLDNWKQRNLFVKFLSVFSRLFVPWM